MTLRRFLFITIAFALLTSPAALAQDERIHLDLETETTVGDYPIPPNGETEWHELAPVWCNVYKQEDYFDNDGDGQLSECDGIKLNDQWFHIEWVGPTVFLNCDDIVVEPLGDITAEPTLGSEWLEVFPNYGEIHTVAEWQTGDVSIEDPNNPDDPTQPEPKECDIVVFEDGKECHVERVGTDIIVTPR